MSPLYQRTFCLLILATAFTLAGPVVFAGDDEFDAIANHIMATYGGKRVRIPFLGLANFAVKIIRPAGVKNFKLATFEQLSTPDPDLDNRFGDAVRQVLSKDWRPLVRVRSRRSNEHTLIYAREAGKDLKLMIVTLEPREATLIRVKLDPRTLAKWMENPKIMGIPIAANK
jgi:hypothetical protein